MSNIPQKVILSFKDDTFVDGINDISEHVAKLEAENTDDSKNRAARLNTKTARYYVGAHSESAISYRRLKVEDAISAAYHALNGGIVAGGGVALLNAARVMNIDSLGGELMWQALQEPTKRIAHNAGHEGANVMSDPFSGLDTRTGKYVNMFEAGIIDPAPVVLNAVKNAISVAATAMTATSLVTLP